MKSARGSRVCDKLFFLSEVKNEIRGGFAGISRVYDKLFYQINPKMKSAGGRGRGGFAGLSQIIFQSKVKNEIRGGFAGLMNFEKYSSWISRGMVQNWNFLAVWKTRQYAKKMENPHFSTA